ncbi:hypothetical protein IKF86_01800 [Candidatus Saccharibacteria bacterium]|nr:hypothetical protein [Candidatus Saccharibacteria bacterium]
MFFILGIFSLIVITMYVLTAKKEEETYRKHQELISHQNSNYARKR